MLGFQSSLTPLGDSRCLDHIIHGSAHTGTPATGPWFCHALPLGLKANHVFLPLFSISVTLGSFCLQMCKSLQTNTPSNKLIDLHSTVQSDPFPVGLMCSCMFCIYNMYMVHVMWVLLSCARWNSDQPDPVPWGPRACSSQFPSACLLF